MMHWHARRAALSGCRCRDPLFGGRPSYSRHPPASEMKKNDNIKIETARSHAYHELTGCLEAE